MLNRETIAYAIMGVMLLVGALFWIAGRKRRKAAKLRRRGIKTHGH